MVYTILISIVFIAELIIAITIIQSLMKLDKAINEYDAMLTETKPSIKDVCILLNKISEQWKVLSQDFVDRIKSESEEILLKQFSRIMIGLLVLNLNFKFIKKLRESKFSKTLAKGWSLVENMV